MTLYFPFVQCKYLTASLKLKGVLNVIKTSTWGNAMFLYSGILYFSACCKILRIIYSNSLNVEHVLFTTCEACKIKKSIVKKNAIELIALP